MELVEYYTGVPAGILQNFLGFAQGNIGQVFVLLEKGATISEPVRRVSESLAYDTSGQPLDLRPHRRTSS